MSRDEAEQINMDWQVGANYPEDKLIEAISREALNLVLKMKWVSKAVPEFPLVTRYVRSYTAKWCRPLKSVPND